MKILHLGTNDIKGGAARAAFRVHTALRKLGYDSTMLVANRDSDDPTVTAFAPSRDFATRLRCRLRRRQIFREFARYRATRPPGVEPFTDDRSMHAIDLVRQLPPCDVINLHWVAGFVDYHAFFSALPQRTAVVWRLADMNVMTGGCHYDEGCGKFLSGCGQCPQLGSSDPLDLSKRIWERKRRTFDSLNPSRLHLVANNTWTADQIRKSPLLGKFPVTIIPNMIDTDVFAPRDQYFARDALGLPKEAKILLFVADSATNKRKGFLVLAEALKGLSEVGNILLLSVGGGKARLDSRIQHVHLDRSSNDRWLSLIYSAADVFVVPSLQECFPNTALESMACGTPVVGFDVGGIPDLVRHGTTGQLVPVGDSGALRHAITHLLNAPSTCRQMAAECRKIVMEEYSYDLLGMRYARLYESLPHQERPGCCESVTPQPPPLSAASE